MTHLVKDTTLQVVLAFWAVVLVGVPFWWKTTEVYRASLPFADIDAWQTRDVATFQLPTTIHIHSSMPRSDALQGKLQQAFHGACATFPLSIQWHAWQPTSPSQLAKDELLKHASDADVGQYNFYIDTSPTQQRHTANVQMGNGRNSLIDIHPDDHEPAFIDEIMSALIPAIFRSELRALSNIACSSDQADKYDTNSMRTFKYSSQYQITFSLMNNNPQSLSTEWDIRHAINQYMSPLLHELKDLSNFTVDSQIQNYAPLSQKPHYKERVNRPNYHYFDPEQLPHFINSADWNLASSISLHPVINFILYIPSAEETPLRIHDAQGNPLLSNSFLIPRWGGVSIKNPPKSALAAGHFAIAKTDLQPIMKIFVSQVRSLMGIQDAGATTTGLPSNINMTFLLAPQTGITTFERDNLIRRRTMENVINAIATLRSLSQLVRDIPNMVVLDQIQDQVHQSLTCIQAVRDALADGHYDAALASSIQAIEMSEKAFFDPTMVSMLYFPDEHKYAIYMPLFVPISVPLVMVLIKTLKKYKAERAAAKTKTE
ncbi:phosphatidylinositol-glycan biosynthesis class S protein [Gongronella butleri]|nr:phosphatidylinositol-glycan biosynthesis class S protein [Gongronella butleri]